MIERCKTEACIGIQATLIFSILSGNGNPFQCSCLENPRDGEAWWAAVYGVTQSRKQLKWLSSRSRKCFLHSQPNPCLLWHKLFLFCLQQRQKNSSTSLCFHLKTVTKLPFWLGILLVLKTHNSHRPSSWTLFANHWIISTAAFLLYLTVIFKLDFKVHYECKPGALSFGWTCFAFEATTGKDSCLGLPYSTTPSRRFCPQWASIYLVRIFKFFKVSCHFVSQGWVWRYLYLVVRSGKQMAVWTGPLYKTDVALHSVTLSESGTVLDPGTKDTVPPHSQCLSLTREINAQLPNYYIREMPWNQ